MSTRVRILIADDHDLVRKAIACLLADQPDFEVIGQASDGREAVEQVRRLRPNVAILDLNMPRLNGIEAAEQIRSTCPDVRVIALSMHDGEAVKSAMRDAGAIDYVEKSGPIERLFTAIRDAGR